MKELDGPTVEYLRFLDLNFSKLTTNPRIRLVVVWLDGDKRIVADWAQRNQIKKLPISVISSKDEALKEWVLNPNLGHNAIFIHRKKVVGGFGELKSPTAGNLANKIKLFEKR